MFLGKEIVIEGLILELSDSALTGAAYLVKKLLFCCTVAK